MSFEHIAKVQGFVKVEYPNRTRIFNESHQIMRTTNNFETFQRRATIVFDYIHWCYDQRDAGMPLKLNMDRAAAVEDFNKIYNIQAVRIAKYISDTSSTPAKAKKAIPLLQKINESLIVSDNFARSYSEIFKYILNMQRQETN